MTRTSSTKVELKKLKSILPNLKQKPTSTPIEIVLETIRYIRQLEDQLIDQYQIDTSILIPLQNIENNHHHSMEIL